MVDSLTKEEIIYLAGLIDGEGYIGIVPHQKKYTRAILSISTTSPEIIDFLKNRVGGQVSMFYPKEGDTHSPYWRWIMKRKKELKELLTKILPYLRCKKANAELVLNYFSCEWGQTELKRSLVIRSRELTGSRI